MRQGELARVEKQLQDVPAGGLTITGDLPSGQESGLLAKPSAVRTDGKGMIEAYSVYPGVDASYTLFMAGEVTFHHGAASSVLEMFYCRSGRVGWNMQGGTAVYLGAGDLTVHSAACCADSTMMFPSGYAEGISIAVDLPCLAAHCPEILQGSDIDFEKMQAALCSGNPAAIPACPELEGIFGPLYAVNPARRRPYLQLKVQELLLYLMDFQPGQRELTQYVTQQTELIREIQQQLTQHLDRRWTIEEISKQYLINTSTLKEVFKAVYGLPIATYMKEYRVRQAMKLLRETDAPVSEIADMVGYRTQGKFSEAFRDVTHMLPTEYRKSGCACKE